MEDAVERETDLKQLALVIITKWKLLLIFMIVGGVIGGMYTQIKHADTSDRQNAMEVYQEDKEYYDRMKTLYEDWIVQAQDVLEAGMPMELPEGKTGIEVAYYALQLAFNIRSAKSILDELKEPIIPANVDGLNVVGGNIIRNLFLGVAGGLIMGVLILTLYFILSVNMMSAAELNCRYGLRALTVLAGDSADKLLRYGRDGAFLRMSQDEQIKVALANISVYAPDAKDLLLIGTVGEPMLKATADKLQEKNSEIAVSYAANINENAASYEMLKLHENVILVEKVLSSKFDEVDNEMKLLRDWNKNVVGTITLM